MKFLQKYLLTISTLSLLSLSSIWAACVQSLDIGNQDLNNTNNLEVDYIFSNANGNITIKTNLVVDGNITFINGNKTITGAQTILDNNTSVVTVSHLNSWLYNPIYKETLAQNNIPCLSRNNSTTYYRPAISGEMYILHQKGLITLSTTEKYYTENASFNWTTTDYGNRIQWNGTNLYRVEVSGTGIQMIAFCIGFSY